MDDERWVPPEGVGVMRGMRLAEVRIPVSLEMVKAGLPCLEADVLAGFRGLVEQYREMDRAMCPEGEA